MTRPEDEEAPDDGQGQPPLELPPHLFIPTEAPHTHPHEPTPDSENGSQTTRLASTMG